MALNPIGGYFRKSYQDFSGGLNTYSSPLTVRQNQFTELTNAVINERGILEKSTGYALDGSPFPNDADSFIRMLVEYRRGSSIQRIVCAAQDDGNTNVTYKVDMKETSGDGRYTYIGYTTGTVTFTNGSPTVVGSGTAFSTNLKAGDKIGLGTNPSAWYEVSAVPTATSLTLTTNYVAVGAESGVAGQAYKARIILDKDFIPSATVFNNNLIITNGIDAVLSYDSTSLSVLGSAPRAKFIVNHKSRLFSAGSASLPSSIFWSAVNDETNWQAESTEPVFANDNGNIVGIVSFADSLIVLKDTGSVYQVWGAFDQSSEGEPDFIRKIDTPANVGLIAGFTAKVGVDNKLYFVAQTGVYSIDARMFVEKVSWNINPTVDDIVLSSGETSAKSYIYDTTAQWNTGSYGSPVGMRGTSNKLSNINDLYTITDATKANNLCSIKVSANGDIHYLYVGTDGKTIKYVLNSIAGVSTSTDVTIAANNVTDLSLDVNSVGDVCFAYTSGDGFTRFFEKLSAGTWAGVVNLATYSSASIAGACAVKYGALVNTNVYIVATHNFQNGGFMGHNRVSGSWDSSAMGTDIGSGVQIYNISVPAPKLDIVLNNSNDAEYFSFVSGTTLYVLNINARPLGYYGVVTAYSAPITANSYFRTQFVKNNTAQRIITYSDGNTIKARNLDSSTTTTVDATYGNHTGLYLNSSNEYSYMRFSSVGTESLVYANTTTIVNGTASVYDMTGLYPNRGFDSNGTIYASIYFGANTNELIIRRMAPVAVWTGPERSDSSLSAYGTYVVSGEVTGGNTVLHEVAVNSISPATTYNTITSGSVVTSDSSKIFVRIRITMTMTSFASSEVDSVIINYTGVGIGPVFPTGIVYNNEYYVANGLSGDAANTNVLVLDRGQAWSKLKYPVSFMTRYRSSLYAGSSTNGDVYKLKQAYRAKSSSYELVATSKEDLLGSVELEKEIYKIYVLYEVKSSGSFSFDYRTDNFKTSGGSTWITSTVDQTAAGIAEIPYIGGPFRSIQFRITANDLDAQLGVIGYVVMYAYLNVR